MRVGGGVPAARILRDVPMAVVVLLYLAIFFWLNRRWLTVADDSIAATLITRQADARLIVWVLEWVYSALVSDWSVLVHAPINHPAPAQLTSSEHFGSSQLLYAPIRLVSGNPILSANIAAILCYPLAASVMYAFLTAAGVAAAPAFASGLMLALGPYQTPGNLHILQYLPLFLPLAALALLRLRQMPNTARAALLAAALIAGLTSSYYTAMMLCAAIVPWAVVEIGTAPRQRVRLALYATAAFLVAVLALIAISLPYLDRADNAATRTAVLDILGGWSWSADVIVERIKLNATGAGTNSLGLPLIVASTVGVFAFFHRDLARYAVAALTVAAAGLFLILGGTGLVVSWQLPGPLGELATLADRFFSLYPRASLMIAFAGSVLTALGLESVRRRLPLVGNGAALCVLVAMLVSRGSILGAPVLIPVDAFKEHREAYERIGLIIAERGGSGSLVELPRAPNEGRNDSRSMMAQLIHHAPLIVGHTGYNPPGRAQVDGWIRRLPDGQALGRLVRDTELRWIVLKPLVEWPSPGHRSDIVRRFEAEGWVREVHQVGEMLLLELRGAAEATLGGHDSVSLNVPPVPTVDLTGADHYYREPCLEIPNVRCPQRLPVILPQPST